MQVYTDFNYIQVSQLINALNQLKSTIKMSPEDIERFVDIAQTRCKYEPFDLEGEDSLKTYVDL